MTSFWKCEADSSSSMYLTFSVLREIWGVCHHENEKYVLKFDLTQKKPAFYAIPTHSPVIPLHPLLGLYAHFVCFLLHLILPNPIAFLAHIGAYILNKLVLPMTEPCGLCGSPSPSCQFHLMKGKCSSRQPKIDYRASRGCPNLVVTFKYGVVRLSMKIAPCSNVPI